MNYNLWAEWSNMADEECTKDGQEILKAFNDVSSGLLILSDYNYIFNILNNNDLEKEYYWKLQTEVGDFTDLCCKFEILRNILVGGSIDWNEVKRSLEK